LGTYLIREEFSLLQNSPLISEVTKPSQSGRKLFAELVGFIEKGYLGIF
jgi:hypothetical protein